MSENKGKPSRQVPDERKEIDAGESGSPRTIHRLDRSRSDEKGGKGELPKRTFETGESKRQRSAGKR
jgi:hypothetical protein